MTDTETQGIYRLQKDMLVLRSKRNSVMLLTQNKHHGRELFRLKAFMGYTDHVDTKSAKRLSQPLVMKAFI